MFTLNVRGSVHQIALVRFFKHLGRHALSDYIELDRDPSYSFIFLASIIRAAHILPPTLFYPRYIAQDLVDGDMFLRLLQTM